MTLQACTGGSVQGTGLLWASGRDEVQHLEFPSTTWGALCNHNRALHQAQNKLLPKTALETSCDGPASVLTKNWGPPSPSQSRERIIQKITYSLRVKPQFKPRGSSHSREGCFPVAAPSSHPAPAPTLAQADPLPPLPQQSKLHPCPSMCSTQPPPPMPQ